MSATGGVAPYAWSHTSGSLPEGLSLNADGTIAGTPTGIGTFDFTVQVADSGEQPQTDTRALSITIKAAELVNITTSALPNALPGTAYAQSLAASGGVTPYSWNVAPGSLPDGLSLDSATGEIAGTPTAVGIFDFVVSVEDSSSPIRTDSQALTINVLPAPLVISTAGLASGTVGAEYSASLVATGGTTPYAWFIPVSGLPSGLSLDSANGTISGTPTVTGTATFTVLVTDSSIPAQTSSRDLSIAIEEGVAVACSSPLGYGENTACTISTGGEQGIYNFAGILGERILARAGKRGSTGLTSPALEIQRPDGTVLCSSSGIYTASANCLLDVSGTRTIAVKSNSSTGTGEFGLYLQRINNPVGGTPISHGGNYPGALDSGAVEDYTFSGAARRASASTPG